MCINILFLIKKSNFNNGVADILEKLRQNEGQEIRLKTRKKKSWDITSEQPGQSKD